MTTREEAIEYCRSMFNDVGVYASDLYRLIGFAETDEDYYYIFVDYQGAIRYSSMVGHFISLKSLPEYWRISKQFYYTEREFQIVNLCKEEK